MRTAAPSTRLLLLDGAGFERLVEVLIDRFDSVVGPVVADGAIRLRPIRDVADLAIDVSAVSAPGSFRTSTDGSGRRFDHAVGPDSLKAIVHPPRTPVWTMRRDDGKLTIEAVEPDRTTVAVIGARACDVRAQAILARTQTTGPHADPHVGARGDGCFVIAVDCTHPAPTCHCDVAHDHHVSSTGADIALTEFEHDGAIAYLVRPLSDAGRDLVADLPTRAATDVEVGAARDQLDAAVALAGAPIPRDARSLVADLEHPRWDDVAERCLACGNCTAVCPTCFCTDVDDAVALDGRTATRDRVWDTCFSLEYSHLGPGPHRSTIRSRYRQWLTHKVGTWHDQFGESGCVGCGRCIVWCPVGIDLTVELAALGVDGEDAS